MRLRALASVLCNAAALSAQAPGVSPRADARAALHPVVLISIDGLKPEYVLDADQHGLKIPHLRALLARGAHASGVIGVVPTVTYPSHTTLVTGVAPARHGIFSNTTFDPLRKNHDRWYWYASDIRVPTLWNAVMRAGGTTANVHWPVTVGAKITWNLPQYWRTGEPDDRKVVEALSTPGLVDALEHEDGAPYADGMDETIEGDELRARFAVRLLERERPDLMLAYFTALDHEQHKSGPFSPAACATLERIDAIVGAMTRAASLAYGGRETLVVVSDHGFMRTSRALNLIHAFREAGLVDYTAGADERPKGWRATLWPAGGAAAVVLNDTTKLALRDSVGRLLQRLAADTANGIDRIIENTELRRRGGFPGAAFLVV